MTEATDGRWVSLRQAALTLECSQKTLESLLKEEGTPVLQLKRNKRIKESDLAALLESRIKPLK